MQPNCTRESDVTVRLVSGVLQGTTVAPGTRGGQATWQYLARQIREAFPDGVVELPADAAALVLPRQANSFGHHPFLFLT